jgi:Mor family transcriptional regulator
LSGFVKYSQQIILKLIAAGKTAKEIEAAIGLTAVKRLKYRFNFNIFQLVVKRRAERVIELYKEGSKTSDISKKVGCTEDYVFMLLRAAGVKLNVFTDAKRNRDKSIYDFIKKGGTITQAAKKWNLSEAMVKLVHKDASGQKRKKN